MLKSDSPELRLITDLSRPHGLSVNDYISAVHFKMDRVDMAMSWMRPGCWMFKIGGMVKAIVAASVFHEQDWSLHFQGISQFNSK